MDGETPSSSPSSRLSFFCSSADYSASDASSPSSRRSSFTETISKTEYLERQRRNNDCAMRNREKRRMSDEDMEHRLLALSQENQMLKSQLESRTASDSMLSTSRISEYPALPSASHTVYGDHKNVYAPQLVPSLMIPSSSHQIPMLQLCHLQAALHHQQQNPPHFLNLAASSSLPTHSRSPPQVASGSAFQPFHHRDSSRIERKSPDSSSDTLNTVPSPPHRPQQSLLGALLSQRRPSPTVPQSTTELRSGLATPPNTGNSLDELKCEMPLLNMQMSSCGSSSKSDSESNSSASLSPSEHSALKECLESGGKTPYQDRRSRNNEAAKRCRANRRAIFEHRSRRVQILESENEDLKREMSELKREIEHFKAMIEGNSRR